MRGQLGFWIAMVITAAACGHVPVGEAGAPAAYSATIRRTALGIPHIESRTLKGLGYGFGYAYAEDNPCIIAEAIVTARGERSRYFGGAATFDPSGAGYRLENLPSDVYFRWLNTRSRVDAAWASQPAEIQDLLRGYATGVSRRLRDVGRDRLPEPCRGQPWVGDISELDLIRLLRRTAVEASGLQMIDQIFAAQPPRATPAVKTGAAGPAFAAASAALVERVRPLKGSNAVALGRDATVSGRGLLLINPHFPWTGGFRLYQAHLTIPGVVDVAGAALPGIPVIGIGHNRDVAWAHTVNTSRHFAFHQLHLDPRDPARYLVDGQSRPLRRDEIAVEVRAPNGKLETVTHAVWSSEHGPLLVQRELFEWTAEIAVAFGDANAENGRIVETWWRMNRATGVAQLRAAVETTLGSPWANTLAVDRDGTAYYGDVTAVPNIPDSLAARCVPERYRALARRGLMVLDASTARCNWVTARGTPQPGLVPAAQLPSLVRSDFVQNSNDSAWLTNPAAPLAGFPAIVSTDGDEQRARTRLGLQQIAARLRGGAAPVPDRFTAERLLETAASNRSFYAGTLLDDLLALCPQGGPAACAILGRWDRRAELASVGYPLFREWRRVLEETAAARGLAFWTVLFDPADPVHTPRGLRTADPAIAAIARDALRDAAARLAAAGVDATQPWGAQNFVVRGDRHIPIHGGGGAKFGGRDDEFYNTINSRPAAAGHYEPYYGTALMLVISFERGGPAARGLLAYSQSTDPASPHAADQLARFSRKDWLAIPFTPDEIARDPELATRHLRE